FIDEDLPRAFAALDDLHILGDLADASIEATSALSAYIEHLEREIAPRAKGSFRLGREGFEQKLRLDEGVTTDAERLLDVAMRELRTTQEEFRRVASRLDGGDPVTPWARAKAEHPAPGQLVQVPRQQLDELIEFITRERVISIPPGAPVAVAPTPRFYRWTFASMW